MLVNIIDLSYRILSSTKIKILFMTVYGALLIVYFFFFTSILGQEPKTRTAKKNFYESSDRYLSGKDVVSVNEADIRIMFNSIDRESGGMLQKYGYVALLEDYIVHIKTDYDTENDKFYNSIVDILENERKEEPYSRLYPEERRLLKNIESSVKNSDAQTAMFNLTALSDVLRINNENLDKLEKQNGWSIPLAIVGLIVTVLFGVISIIRPFQLRGKDKS